MSGRMSAIRQEDFLMINEQLLRPNVTLKYKVQRPRRYGVLLRISSTWRCFSLRVCFQTYLTGGTLATMPRSEGVPVHSGPPWPQLCGRSPDPACEQIWTTWKASRTARPRLQQWEKHPPNLFGKESTSYANPFAPLKTNMDTKLLHA